MHTETFKQSTLAKAISLASLSVAVFGSATTAAQEKTTRAIEEVIVTSARREQSVQDIPINISAINAEAIEDLRLTGIAEISNYVPGLTVIDRGPRDQVPDVFVRGLNTSGLGPGFTSDTVAVYLGDIPVNVDLKPNDLERVEVLIGPQGTLYGQGTMGGAIRYIPKTADLDEFSGEVRGDISANEQSEDVESELGITLNVPLIENVLAVRANLDFLDDPGFIDYPYLVREPGVSDPQPDFRNPDEVDANLFGVEDANGEETLSGRLNLHWVPNNWLDLNLWYYYQDTKAEGRQITNRVTFDTGRYESAARYLEPNDYTNDLISLDADIDVGFAELTLAYGKSTYDELGQRDQTDLLLGFEYGYEAFPSFSAFTRETDEQETETFEMRLVSQHEGPLQWVVGYFDNTFEQDAVSEEFTPGFDQFAVDNFGGVQLRPDSLEYIQLTNVKANETAFFGELSYDILSNLTATLGYRAYKYDVFIAGGFGLPLFNTVFEGEPQDAVEVDIGVNDGEDDGDLLKFNLSWDIDADNMIYATFSEGYRNGGVNAVPECTPEQLASTDQQLCAKEDEVFIDPDTIDNYEIGYKGVLADGSLTINADIYYIDWQGLQVDSTTDLGNLPITGNGSEAESKGLEMQAAWFFTDNWRAALTYANTQAKLTEDAPGLVGPATARAGARLPGHAEHQGSFNITYFTKVMNDIDMEINYGFVFTSDVYNIVGGPDDPLFIEEEDGTITPADRGGEAIDGYDVHHLSATFSKNDWRVQGYIDNLFDTYYILGTRVSRRGDILQNEQTGPGTLYGGFVLRSYGEYVGRPRTAGVRLSYQF